MGLAEIEEPGPKKIESEETAKREGYHGRDMLSSSLTSAADEWRKRQAAGALPDARASSFIDAEGRRPRVLQT